MSHFRGLEQEYELIENCLPEVIDFSEMGDNLDYLISHHGRLAAAIY